MNLHHSGTAARSLGSLLLAGSLLAACCTAPAPGPGGEAGAAVERIEILILESFPVQVNATIVGSVPDTCTFITRINQRSDLEENRLFIDLETTRQEGEECTRRPVPFEEKIPLEVLGLPAGTYTVDVNGVTTTFELEMDNVPEGPCSYVYAACRELIKVPEAGIQFSVLKEWEQVGPYEWSPDGALTPRIGFRWQEVGSDWKPEDMLPAGYEVIEQQTPELDWGEGEFYFVSVSDPVQYELHVIARQGDIGYDFYAVGTSEEEMVAVEEIHYLVTAASRLIEPE